VKLANDTLYWLPADTDVFTLESEARARLGIKRDELEEQLVAERFISSFDAFLFGITVPGEEPISDPSEPVSSLVSVAYLNILGQQTDLETLGSTEALEYNPFRFDMRVARDNTTGELLIDVQCRSIELLHEFESIAAVQSGRKLENDIVPRELRSTLSEAEAAIERVFGSNPLETPGWYFELCARTTPTLKTATSDNIIRSTPSKSKRARSLANLLVAEYSRDILLALPSEQIPLAIGRFSNANTADLVAALAEQLPLITPKVLESSLESVRDSLAHHVVPQIDLLAKSTLKDALTGL
jgi:hypothetical protein